MTDVPSDVVEYPVQRVTDWVYIPHLNRVYYKIVYQRIGGGNYTPQAQPLSVLLTCPLLLVDFEQRQFRKLKETTKKADRERRKKPRLGAWFLKRNLPLVEEEYVPTGGEQAVFILSLRSILIPWKAMSKPKKKTATKKRRRGRAKAPQPVETLAVTFYSIRFDLMVHPVLVRELYLEYWFPVDLLVYLKCHENEPPDYC